MIAPEAAMNTCIEWLKGEEAYQFRKYGQPRPDDFEARINTFIEREVPDWWHRYRIFRGDAPNHASQMIMKACAYARAAAVIGNMAAGAPYEFASWTTLHDLEQAAPVILPRLDDLKRRLTMPFDIAMGPARYRRETVQTSYLVVAGLAIAHVVDDARNRGELWLPEPGHLGGEIVPWDKTL